MDKENFSLKLVKIIIAIVFVVIGYLFYYYDFEPNLIKGVSLVVVPTALIAFLLYYWPFSKKHENALDSIEEESPNSYSLILIQNMSENEINEAIESFNKMGKEEDENFENYTPEIKTSGKDFMLLFSPTINYRDFCFWVNYLVYSNKDKRHNNDITGWYELRNTTNNHPLSNKILMFFIPESDKEFDNVYLVDNFNNCYKQEFALDEKIIPQNESIIRYKERPDYRPE